MTLDENIKTSFWCTDTWEALEESLFNTFRDQRVSDRKFDEFGGSVCIAAEYDFLYGNIIAPLGAFAWMRQTIMCVRVCVSGKTASFIEEL